MMGRSIGTEAAAALREFGAGRSTGWRRFGPVGVEYRLDDGALLWRPINADRTTDSAYADDDGAGEVEFERIDEDGALEALACGLLLARNAEVGEEPELEEPEANRVLTADEARKMFAAVDEAENDPDGARRLRRSETMKRFLAGLLVGAAIATVAPASANPNDHLTKRCAIAVVYAEVERSKEAELLARLEATLLSEPNGNHARLRERIFWARRLEISARNRAESQRKSDCRYIAV